MSRTPRRASKQVDYANFGDGEDEDSLDLSAEDAEDDEDRPKKREKKEPTKKKDDKKKPTSRVIIDDNDDDVVLVEDRDADDFDLGRRILSNIAQKIPEIIKPKKKNIIDDDEVINLEEDDPEPVITFRNLPKIGGQTIRPSSVPTKELSPREPVVEKQPTKRERTPPKKRIIDSDSDDNDFSGEADDYDDDFGFEEERSRSKSKKRKAEPKEKKAPAKRAKRNKDDDVSVSISESVSTRKEEPPKPKPVSIVIEPVKEIIPERKVQAAPVKEVVIKEVNTTSSSNKKKEPSIESEEEEERSVSTSNQPAIETKRDKRALITSAANTQYGGNNTTAANGHSSPVKKKDESDEEVTSGPSTPLKPKPVVAASTSVPQSKPIVTNSSPKKPGLSKANGEQSIGMNLGVSPVRRRVGLSRTQRVPSLHGDK